MEKFWNNYWRIWSVPMLGMALFFAGTMVGDLPEPRQEPYSIFDAFTAFATFLVYWFIGWAAGRESKQ